MTNLLTSATKQDFIIDKAYGLPKPKNLPASSPRDVIMRVNFFHIKEALMRMSRENPQLPEPYHMLYADLSQFTIQARQSLQPVTLALWQHNIQYRWGFHTKLLITRNGQTHMISSIKDRLPILKSLDTPLSLPTLTSTSCQIAKVRSEWSTVRLPP